MTKSNDYPTGGASRLAGLTSATLGDPLWKRMISVALENETGTGTAAVVDDEEDDAPDGPDASAQWEGYAKKLRKENAAKRTQLRNIKEAAAREKADLEKKLADLQSKYDTDLAAVKTSSQVDVEKAVNDLKASQTKARVDDALKAALTAEKVVNIDDALKLVDGSVIKVGDDGAISGIKELVDGLKKDKAYLFGSSAPTTSSTSKAPAAKEGATDVRALSPAEYDARKRELLGVRSRRADAHTSTGDARKPNGSAAATT